jgi:DNA repair protein RecN (Recombination protein N)
MLKSLLIKNYALINDLMMEPSAQFNIITGETGAGKSIMLGAVGLLLGNRADTKVLMVSEEKCVVEGKFDVSDYDQLLQLFEEEELDYEKECIIRREISPSGKSRAFINDTPVTLESLRKIGEQLMDVHSQHETLQLGDQQFQLQLVDNYAENTALLKEYKALYAEYKQAEKAYQELKTSANKSAEELDYQQFLFDELYKAQWQEDEQSSLEEELEQLENAEEIKAKLLSCLQLMDNEELGALPLLRQTEQLMRQLAKYGERYRSLQERISSGLIELQDSFGELSQLEEHVMLDEERIEQVKSRLSLLYHLQSKHKVSSISELLAIQTQLEQQLQQAANFEGDLAVLAAEVERKKLALSQLAEVLSKRRKAVFGRIEEEVSTLLRNLGMGDASLKVQHQAQSMSHNGSDAIDLLFSANKGVAPQALKQVASGGEFSRLMFCFKYVMADKAKLPTIVFDEIDTGISGEIALKMAAMMKQMAKNHQVIVITHLPQIAAKGDTHFFVFKDLTASKAASKIRRLDGEERLTELAKMIGGDNYSETALSSAKELVNNSIDNA